MSVSAFFFLCPSTHVGHYVLWSMWNVDDAVVLVLVMVSLLDLHFNNLHNSINLFGCELIRFKRMAEWETQTERQRDTE